MTTDDIVAEFAELYKENFNDFEFDDVELVEEGDWAQDSKYQHRDSVVKYKDTFIQISESRSGSYHTDWYYGDSTIGAVERKEKVVASWESFGKSIEVPSLY